MRREITLLTLGAGLALIGLSDYGTSHAKTSPTARTIMGLIAQSPSSSNNKSWYNCTTREIWSPEKQAWCQKVDNLKNIRYDIPYFAAFQLKQGTYENLNKNLRVALIDKPGAISFGDVNNDGKEDAITLLAVNAGGSGVFYYLTTVVNINDTPKNQASVLLGDRIQVQSIAIGNTQVKVDMITHSVKDPLCCPSKPMSQIYALRENTLEPLRAQTVKKKQLHSQDLSQSIGDCHLIPRLKKSS